MHNLTFYSVDCVFLLNTNLDINHDLYAGGIRKNQDHPYLYGVVLTFLRGKIAKVEAEAKAPVEPRAMPRNFPP